MPFLPDSYGAAFSALLSYTRNNPLDGGAPNKVVRADLDALSVGCAFEGARVVNEDMAFSCVSAVWLYHNFLDESHTICQDIHTTTGSYWHGIMHRREPDFPNSKYWFRKVGDHEAFPGVCDAARAASSGASGVSGFLASQAAWDPFAFVDLCEAALGGDAGAEPICRAVQQAEFEVLFDRCYKAAVGA